jgi:WhiB family redox-sensing transcriptional regulator
MREPDDPLAWQDDALCAQVSQEMFFPEKGGSTRDAKRICESCNVKAQCLAYAQATEERFGIWGGKSERERRALRKAAS